VRLDAERRWLLRFAFAHAQGADEATRAPLNSVDPDKAVVGLGYAAPSGRWGGDVVVTLVDAKEADDVAGNRLATRGYGIVDVLARYAVNERIRLNAGLFNIGDKRYVEWADTAAIGFDAGTGTYPEAARFTRPGMNAAVTLRIDF
jgi:hemoglobin/transferrin/lactoferrin receptor protein